MINVSVLDELLVEIDDAVSAGRFGSRSELVRTALREYLGIKKSSKIEPQRGDLPKKRYVA